jgi:signal peptidase I
MNPLYHTGDIVIVHRQAHYRVGEIVAYIVPKGTAGAGAQVIHRLIGGDENKGFVVQGDNRTAPDVWHPRRNQIVGTAWLHIPKAGTAVVLLHTPLFLASLAAGIAVACAIQHGSKRPDHA